MSISNIIFFIISFGYIINFLTLAYLIILKLLPALFRSIFKKDISYLLGTYENRLNNILMFFSILIIITIPLMFFIVIYNMINNEV